MYWFCEIFPISVLKITQTGIEMTDYHYWLQCRLIAFVIVCCRMLPSCTLVLAKIRVRLLWMRTLIFGIWFSPDHLSYANHWLYCVLLVLRIKLWRKCAVFIVTQLNNWITSYFSATQNVGIPTIVNLIFV